MRSLACSREEFLLVEPIARRGRALRVRPEKSAQTDGKHSGEAHYSAESAIHPRDHHGDRGPLSGGFGLHGYDALINAAIRA